MGPRELVHNSCRESELDIDHFGLNLKVDSDLEGYLRVLNGVTMCLASDKRRYYDELFYPLT